jgi:hypothetical protein
MFTCCVCNIELSSVYKFKQHVLTKTHISKLSVKQHSLNEPNTVAISQLAQSTNNLVTTNVIKTPSVCKYCDKKYSTIYNLKRHYDTCKPFIQFMENEKNKIINDISNGVCNTNNLSGLPTLNNGTPINIVINNITNNNTLNGDLNISVTNTINKEDEFYEFWKHNKVNPVGFENTEMLNNQAIADKIHGNGLNAFMEYIKAVYSNTENHNVTIYNKRDKLVKYISANGNIEITTLNKILDMLVMNNIDGLDVFLDRKDISIKKSYKNIIDKLKFIHEQDGDNPYLETYIRELYLIILNISTSALTKITALEKALNNTSDELSMVKSKLVVPRTDFRTVP